MQQVLRPTMVSLAAAVTLAIGMLSSDCCVSPPGQAYTPEASHRYQFGTVQEHS